MKASLGLVLVLTAHANAQEPVRLAGASCATPPVLHCPDKECSGDRVINPDPWSR